MVPAQIEGHWSYGSSELPRADDQSLIKQPAAVGAKVVPGGWSQKRSVYPEDLAATIYSAMGIDYSKKITNTPSGRAFEYLEPFSATTFMQPSEIETLFT